MDFEKKYKFALKWARDIYPKAAGAFKEDLEHYFPELVESEDERIRNGLIALLKFGLEDGSAIAPGFNETKEEAIAWLEKQGEHKHVEWSEEDEEYYDDAMSLCKDGMCFRFQEIEIADWLKSLKQRLGGGK